MKKIVINIFKVKFLLVISLMSFLIIMDLKVAFSADYYQNYDEFLIPLNIMIRMGLRLHPILSILEMFLCVS